MSIYEFAIKEFERHYDSLMTVWNNEPVKVGPITTNEWVEAEGLVSQPCRIVQKKVVAATDGVFAEASTIIILNCNPALKIDAGSRIDITDVHGVTKRYKRSSEGFASYRTHQEIVIVRDVKA